MWFHSTVNIFHLGYYITPRQIWIICLCVDCNNMPGSLPPNIHGNVWKLLPGKVQHSDSLLLCFSELHWVSGKPGACMPRLHFIDSANLKYPLGSWPYWSYWELCHCPTGDRSLPTVYRITSENLFFFSFSCKPKLSGPYSKLGPTWPCIDLLNPNSLLQGVPSQHIDMQEASSSQS